MTRALDAELPTLHHDAVPLTLCIHLSGFSLTVRCATLTPTEALMIDNRQTVTVLMLNADAGPVDAPADEFEA